MKSLITLSILALSIISCNNSKKEELTKPIEDSVKITDNNIDTDLENPIIKKDTIKEDITNNDDLTKAYIMLSKGDSAVYLQSNIRKDHQIYGYQKPNINSRKLILFSVFTSDVDKNPHQLPLGAYYETSGLAREGFKLKYTKTVGDFIETIFKDATNIGEDLVYFKKNEVIIE